MKYNPSTINSLDIMRYTEKYAVKIFCLFMLMIMSSCKKSSQSREYYYKDIDILLKKADYYIFKDNDKSITFSLEAAKISEKIDDSDRKALAYYFLAKNYSFLQKFDSCQIFLKKGLAEENSHSNDFTKALLISASANYYSRVGLLQEQSEENHKLLQFLKNKKDLNSTLIYSNALISKADNLTELADYRSAHFFADKALAIVDSIPREKYMRSLNVIRGKPFIYYYKGKIFLEQGDLDAALPFIEKAYRFAKEEDYGYTSLFLESYGDYYMMKEKYDDAIKCYDQSIKNKIKFHQRTAYLDYKISEVFLKVGKIDSANFHLARSSDQRDIDLKMNNRDSAKAELYLDQKEDHMVEKESNSKTFFFIAIIIVLFIIGIFFYLANRNDKRDQRLKDINNASKFENQKNEITSLTSKLNASADNEHRIHNQMMEVSTLEAQPFSSYDELIELGKRNSPQFWIRFQEVYPEYSRKMLSVNSSLRATELTLSAYVFLGFTSKEIASYTFKSLKTIDNNRSNLRKKIDISKEMDLSVWLRKFMS